MLDMDKFVDTLLAEIRADEGWRPYGYDDATGKPATCEGWLTIGYGFLIDGRKGGGVPKPVAEYWLRYAVNERIDEFRRLWPAFARMPDTVQLALANMAYQIGPAGLLKFQKMLDALQAGRRDLAAAEALSSTWATQTPERAQRVAALIRGRA